jgi:hypothetical protein
MPGRGKPPGLVPDPQPASLNDVGKRERGQRGPTTRAAPGIGHNRLGPTFSLSAVCDHTLCRRPCLLNGRDCCSCHRAIAFHMHPQPPIGEQLSRRVGGACGTRVAAWRTVLSRWLLELGPDRVDEVVPADAGPGLAGGVSVAGAAVGFQPGQAHQRPPDGVGLLGGPVQRQCLLVPGRGPVAVAAPITAARARPKLGPGSTTVPCGHCRRWRAGVRRARTPPPAPGHCGP